MPEKEFHDSVTKEQDSTHEAAVTSITNTLTPLELKNSSTKYDASNILISLSKVTLQQDSLFSKPYTKQKRNAGAFYWTNGKWYCKHCKFSGDKFDVQNHYCKNYKPSPKLGPEQEESKVQHGDGDSN